MRNFKKTLLIFLPLLAIFALLLSTVSASNPATIRVHNVEGLPGTTVDIPVYFENADGIGGGVVTLSYDPTKVTPVSVTKNPALPWDVPQERDSLENVSLNIQANLDHSANTIKLAWIVDPRIGLDGTAKLCDVRFQVNHIDGSAVSVVSGAADDFMLFSTEADLVQSSSVDGNLAGRDLDQVQYGDINNDGRVNFRDARLALEAGLGLITLGEKQTISADVNLDDRINFRDARLILEYGLGLIDELPVPVP